MNASSFSIALMVAMDGDGTFYESFSIEHENGSSLDDLSRDDLTDLATQLTNFLGQTSDAYEKMPPLRPSFEKDMQDDAAYEEELLRRRMRDEQVQEGGAE